MPPILTAEDVVKRIATECAFVDERGAVGIRLQPAAAIVRQYERTLPAVRPDRTGADAGERPRDGECEMVQLHQRLRLYCPG